MVDCCNVYNAPSGSLDPGQGLRNLLDLSECPDIVAGDFNIHHSLWDQTARRDPPNGPGESVQGRLHFAACDWPAFDIFLKDRLTHPPLTNLDDEATFLAEALEGALRVACPSSRIKSVGAPCWSQECAEAH
ncbi:hypothetical protein K3495_g12548 [Podosphaera aphanis]|nr:hypothetical protein K3495_g12548 [Podosphaera aphanis]